MSQQEKPSKTAETITKLSLLAQFLGLLEKVLPAFLIAWNNQLRQKNKQLELKLEQKQIADDVETFKEAQENAKKSPEDVINSFLSK